MAKETCKNICKWSLILFIALLIIAIFFIGLTKFTSVANEYSDSIDSLTLKNLGTKYSEYIQDKNRDSLALVLREYENSIRKIQRESSERVRQQIESVNTNISIWMAIIAGICTLLPMASSLYQISQIEKIEENKEKDKEVFKKKVDDAVKEMEKKKNEINKNVEDYKKEIEKTRLLPSISLLESNIRLISELQDFQLKNRITLINDDYVKNILDLVSKLSNNSKIILDNLVGVLNTQESDQVRMSIHNAYCSLSNLLVTLEGISKEEDLFNVLVLSDKIRMESIQFINERNANTTDSINEVKQAMGNIDSHIQSVKTIIQNMIDNKE